MNIETQQAPDLKKLGDLIEDFRVAMLVTLDEDDRLVSRPMAPLKMDRDGAIWFFTDVHSDKVQQIDRVNLSFLDEDESTYVSVAGHGELSDDRNLMRELWTSMMVPWFPEGVESPELTLLKVTPQSVEYWDATHGKMVRMFAMAASVLASRPIGMGDHGTLSLMDSP